jgi:hypothetical protein
MRPVVIDDENQFDGQTHAYAEYRVFSGLTTEHASLAQAVVVLTRAAAADDTHEPGVTCTIHVTTASGVTLETGATEHHPYAAIDTAAALTSAALRAHWLEHLAGVGASREPTRESA